MAKLKISKVAKDLNVSVATIIEFLGKKNIAVEDNPNTRLEESVVDMLMGAFKSDKDLKNKSNQFTIERKENREANKPAEEAPKAEKPANAPTPQKPRILGCLLYPTDAADA